MPSLSEQVRELEAELAAANRSLSMVRLAKTATERALAAAESRLAQARAEGAREAFVEGAEWLASEMVRLDLLNVRFYPTKGEKITTIQGWSTRDEANKRYPAPASGEQGKALTFCGEDGCTKAKGHGGAWHDNGKECWPVADSRPTPSPVERVTLERDSYEGPIVALSLTEMSDGGEKLLITPADARRIVSLAAQDGGAR